MFDSTNSPFLQFYHVLENTNRVYILSLGTVQANSWIKDLNQLKLKGVVVAFKGFLIANCRKSTNRRTNFYLSLIYLNKNLAS